MIKCSCAAESEISATLFGELIVPVFHEMSGLEFVPCRRLLPGCVLLLSLTNLQLYLDASLLAFLAGFHVCSTLFSVEATLPSSCEFS